MVTGDLFTTSSFAFILVYLRLPSGGFRQLLEGSFLSVSRSVEGGYGSACAAYEAVDHAGRIAVKSSNDPRAIDGPGVASLEPACARARSLEAFYGSAGSTPEAVANTA